MKIVLSLMLFLFPFSVKGEASYGEPFHFSVIPHAGNEGAEFELLIKNKGEASLQLEFPTSQYYEITVTDQSGNEVYRYSKGRFFLQALQNLKIEPLQTYRKIESWDYKVNGKRVPPGEYTVTATLLPSKINEKSLDNSQTLVSKVKFTLP